MRTRAARTWAAPAHGRSVVPEFTHQEEIEAELAAIFARRAPELVGNSYLPLGTLDRDVWKRGVAEPLPVQDMLEHLHDFAEVLELRHAGM